MANGLFSMQHCSFELSETQTLILHLKNLLLTEMTVMVHNFTSYRNATLEKTNEQNISGGISHSTA